MSACGGGSARRVACMADAFNGACTWMPALYSDVGGGVGPPGLAGVGAALQRLLTQANLLVRPGKVEYYLQVRSRG